MSLRATIARAVGAAAALHELTCRVGLIRAINIDRQLLHFIEIHHRDRPPAGVE